MNRRKMRNLPPVIVSIFVGMIFAGVAVSAIQNSISEFERAEQVNYYNQPRVVMAAQEAIEKTTLPQPQPEKEYTSAIHSRDWDAEESQMLMKLAMAEAEGESVEGKALVMLVVLNRVWSDDFPGTIEEVIFQPKQFSPVTEGGRYYTTEPNEECREALELVMNGWDESGGALYFESCEGGSWHSENLEYLFQEGNHKFYR